jgi:hypothetical protein
MDGREAAVNPMQTRELRSRSLIIAPVRGMNAPMLSTERGVVKLDFRAPAAGGGVSTDQPRAPPS